MDDFNPNRFGTVFAELLDIDRRRPLDAGWPDSAALNSLIRATPAAAFAHTQIADADMAACCISAVWLLHDFLDESHTISQDIDTPTGSFWHGIMHRREGDFGNAKYWFRRVGAHPAFKALAARATAISRLGEARPRGPVSPRPAVSSFGETRLQVWDPFAFVDLCQSAARGSAGFRELCLDLQQAEWETLFDYCYTAATGG